MSLSDIQTFVIVILENRSFDHVCGYLSLPGADPPLKINGLQADPAWIHQFDNEDHDGTPRSIHLLDPTRQNITDPPHEDNNIDIQINTPTHSAASPKMGGFVKSYWDASPRPTDRSPVMGYYDKRAVPVFDFFARNFAICDNWFSPLPAGTQTNRLMAMSGESHIHHNVADPFDFPIQPLVYDWLASTNGQNSWCSYQWGGVPFFSLMRTWWPRIMADFNDPSNLGSFRRYDAFKGQWQNNPDAIPGVVFIEPKYTDDPTFSFRQPNDDHCPTGVAGGQEFIADIYNTIVGNVEKWKSTMLIVTYDEHGGFFDHVPPPTVPAHAGGVNFATTGVRVPGFIISPYVKAGTVFSDLVDTTSILQLLADRYTPGKAYSAAVAARQSAFKPLKTILENSVRAPPPDPIPEVMLQQLVHGFPAAALDTGKPSATAQALQKATVGMAKTHPAVIRSAKTT